MALQLAAKLETEHQKIRRNADDPAAVLEGFITVATCVRGYFYEAERAPQSSKVRESMAEFGWRWIELRNFPLRRLLPSMAGALNRFPECKGLVLVIADLCLDIFKQNVLAKMEALRAGVLQGLLLAAGHLALSDSFSGDDFLLAGRIFEALRKMIEPPSIQFYSRTRETKDRFYGLERQAWGEVNLGTVLKVLEENGEVEKFDGLPAANHGLVLTLHFLRKYSNGETMEHYLQVIKNMGEAFENTFPGTAGNEPFHKYLEETLEGARAPNLPRAMFATGDCSDLLEEVFLILKRTLNPTAVPWDHRTPCLLPSLNDLYQSASNVENTPMTLEVFVYLGTRQRKRSIALETARRFPIPDYSSNRAGTSRRDRGARTCAQCAKVQRDRAPGSPHFKKCARCHTTYYCDQQCQRLHWPEHRRVCVPIAPS